MPDNSLTILITEIAKLRISIDVIPNRPLRDALESELETKRIEAENIIPGEIKHEIDEMIENEIDRQLQN